MQEGLPSKLVAAPTDLERPLNYRREGKADQVREGGVVGVCALGF